MSKGQDTPTPTYEDPLASFGQAAEDKVDVIAERYVVVKKVGQGGMGRVYKAHDNVLDRDVAVKLLNRELNDDHFVMRFQQEARAASQVSHPNILCVLDFGMTGTQPYLVMEWVNGETLDDRLERLKTLPPAYAIDVVCRLAEAMQQAHRSGIVHRDLKPSNIILQLTEIGERALILDFGIAKIMDAAKDKGMLTLTGQIIGSPRCMSPEQARGEHLDGRSDIYSLGCVLFEMLTGKPPFSGSTAMATIGMHLTDPIPKISEVSDKQFPEGLEEIVCRTLAKDPDDRFPSMLALKEALEELDVEPLTISIADLQPVEKTEPPPGITLDTTQKKLIIACISLLLLGSCLMVYRPFEKPAPLPTEKNEKPKDPKKTINQFENGAKRWAGTNKPIDAKDGAVDAFVSQQFVKDINLHPDQFISINNENNKPNSANDLEALIKSKKGIFHLKFFDVELTPDMVHVLEKSTQITEFRFQSVKMSDASIQKICHINRLRMLKFVDMPVSTEAVRQLRSNKRIEDLQFYSCGLTDDDLKQITALTSLTALELKNNGPFSHEALSQLAKLKSIKLLHLDKVGVTDKDLIWLSTMKNLETLSLQDEGPFTCVGLAKLQNLKKLATLHLNNTGVDELCMRSVAKIPKLKMLDLTGNKSIDAGGLEHLRRRTNQQEELSVVVGQTGIDFKQMNALSMELGINLLLTSKSGNSTFKKCAEDFLNF